MDWQKNERLKQEWTTFYLDGFLETGSDYQGLKEANGRQRLYNNIPIYIEPSHLIVGRLDLGIGKEVVTNYVSAHMLHSDRLEKCLEQKSITKEKKAELVDRFEEMKKYSLFEFIKTYATEDELLVEESGAAFCQHFNGHLAYSFDYVLQRGWNGILEDLDAFAAHNGHERENFYEALQITVKGMQNYIARHAEYARLLMDQKGYDRNQLEKIAVCCENISQQAPRTFYEAVQLVWFMIGFTDYDSFSRSDQYLFPFYQCDLENGVVTRAEALEYIKDMFRRVDDNGSIINMTIGGQTQDRVSVVNDLTYLILEATRATLLKGPNLCLRITKDADIKLWHEVVITLSTGQGLPALYNDDVFIPMLINHGIAQEDAYAYTLVGCSQAVIPNKTNYACDMGLYTPAKMLELALFNGYDPRLQKQVSIQTGDAASFQCFDELLEAYSKQMKYCVEKGVALNNQDMIARKDFLSCVRTLLTENCIQSGLGLLEGGAVYNGIQGEIVGLTNTANGLIAIKELVFEQNEITMPELLTALRADFVGFESLRCKLLGASKFGNRIDSVDELRGAITRELLDEISAYEAPLGGVHWGGEVVFSYYWDQAHFVGALPDGKKSGAVLADSAGPSQGTDVKGVTSVMNSMRWLPFDSLYTSINLNLKFEQSLWNGQIEKMTALLQGYFDLGGCQLQINVLDHQMLLAALDNPEGYKNLIVRVGGFSAYFTQLSKEMQMEIVSRTTLTA